MKVYIVMGVMNWEGENILGVYLKRRDAELSIREYKKEEKKDPVKLYDRFECEEHEVTGGI